MRRIWIWNISLSWFTWSLIASDRLCLWLIWFFRLLHAARASVPVRGADCVRLLSARPFLSPPPRPGEVNFTCIQMRLSFCCTDAPSLGSGKTLCRNAEWTDFDASVGFDIFVQKQNSRCLADSWNMTTQTISWPRGTTRKHRVRCSKCFKMLFTFLFFFFFEDLPSCFEAFKTHVKMCHLHSNAHFFLSLQLVLSTAAKPSAAHGVILLSRDTRQAVLMPLHTDSFPLSSRASAVQTVEYITASKAT